jgi:predicted DNA-binding protein
LATNKPNKGLVNRKPVNNSLDLKLWERLDDLASRTGLNKSTLLDEAIILLLKKYESFPSREQTKDPNS